QPESYTSQTSFLDNEKPCWDNGNSSRKKQGKLPINRRIKRGLFRSNQGYLINADVNGALQIMTKNQVFCDRSEPKQIIGCVLHPRKWSPHF
ncbi:MAG: transposase, partial [Lactobacillus crispatus]|nr:transposase [Lactobacillus crispatus]